MGTPLIGDSARFRAKFINPLFPCSLKAHGKGASASKVTKPPLEVTPIPVGLRPCKITPILRGGLRPIKKKPPLSLSYFKVFL